MSLVPPPCDELTTSEPSRSATRVRPPGTRLTVLPDSTYGPQVDVPRREPAFDERRAGRKRQRRLGDVLVGRREDPLAERFELGRGRGRADQHAVAAGAVGFLDDELRQMREHVIAILLAMQEIGRNIGEHRLLGQVEADHVRHVRIDRLVVGHAGADGVGERDPPGAIGGEEAGHSEHRIGPERERIEKVVVDAPVDHVHALRSVRRAHVDRVVLDEEIRALDQLDPHLLRQERVLEIRRVVGAGRQHGHRRPLLARRREPVQVREQQVGVVLDGADALRGEELREKPHHHLAVFEHVGHAGRNPQIVLEDVELARAGADEVDAGDVGVDAAGNVDALHLGAILGVRQHPLRRHDAGLEDRLIVIDVVQKRIQCLHALLQAAIEHFPFVAGDDPRHEIERDQPFAAGFLAVDRERDADAMEGPLRLFPLLGDAGGRRAVEPPGERLVRRADAPVRGAHFIVD